jgi:general secretion pathway protein A
MYQHYYGLRELPFELTPNPRFLYLPPRHREALSNLQYGLSSAKAITVLIGEAGTGKTTLLRAALESEACRNVQSVYLNNPTLTTTDFIRLLAIRFELSAPARRSKAVFLDEMERVLKDRRASGTITALVVDEAQSLSTELLEELRLLANVDTPDQKLLPLVLAGQPELRDRLNDPGLRQLKQRVALRCELGPFDLAETAAYIANRIAAAGGNASGLFSREAVTRIYEYSGGIPRTISVLCDNALVSSMALGRRRVDHAIVMEVGRDFGLAQPPSDVPADVAENDVIEEAPAPAEAPQKRGPFGWFRRARNPYPHAAEVLTK